MLHIYLFGSGFEECQPAEKIEIIENLNGYDCAKHSKADSPDNRRYDHPAKIRQRALLLPDGCT
jgi:hypothetical protein